MRLAVLFHRFGPYHWARLQATGRRCDLYGIETSAESRTYAWERIDETASFEHLTVYPDGDIRDLPARQIADRISSTLSEVRPDVVAVHGWGLPDALAATAWCRRTGTPSVIMSDSTATDFSRTWWRETVKQRIVQMHQAGFVAGRRHVAYLSALGMPADRITTGYDVVDNPHFACGAREACAHASQRREELGLPPRYFLASGRFVPKKNLHHVLKAYALYRDRSQTPWDLVVLGDGPLRDDLLQHRKALQLARHVQFPGFRPYHELPAYYGLADAFIHASTTEQWGLVVNEAMAAGLPVLVSEQCGCAPDLVEHGRNGFVFDAHDENKLVEYMIRVASPSCDRDAMGARSKTIISRWTPDTFAQNLLKAADIACCHTVDSSAVRLFDAGMVRLLQRVRAA